MNNATIARKLLDHAAGLEANGHHLYRVRAYRRAAAVVRMLPAELSELVREGGRAALESLPGIGAHLACTLETLVRTGDFRVLGPKPEERDPRDWLLSLPGVGARTAERLKEAGVETVTDAEAGRLEETGISGKRLGGIVSAVGNRRAERQTAVSESREPSAADLLAADEEFCLLAAGQDCCPVVTLRRNGWTFRVSFSQCPLAHRLGQTRDWVVIRFMNGEQSGERTVVTETRQPLRGQRVVRGRESECQACWAS